MQVSASALAGPSRPERRRTPRIEVLGQLHGSIVALRMNVVVREVGPGGFSIETGIPFPNRSIHQFRFSAIHGGPDMILAGESAHCLRVTPDAAEPRYLTGFTFVCDDDPSRRKIARLTEMLEGGNGGNGVRS